MPDDDEHPAVRHFTRTGDNARIEILPDADFIKQSPHQIGDEYILEGIVVPAKVTLTGHLYAGKINYENRGKETTETKTELTPFVLIAHPNEGDTGWIDVKPYLAAAGPRTIGKTKLDFHKFGRCRNMMSYETAQKIEKCQHINGFSLKGIIEDTRNEFRRLIEVDDEVSTAIGLWTVGSYIFDAFNAYPYSWFNGLRGTGKTRGLEFLAETAYHAEMGADMTKSVLFRLVEQHRATICYDEAENLLRMGGKNPNDRELVGLFNSGYKASGRVHLSTPDGDDWSPKSFSSYSPKALASISPIDDAMQSRCVVVPMMNALGKKSEETLNYDYCETLREKLFFFRFSEGVRFKDNATNSHIIETLCNEHRLKNRDWELFAPLLMIAESICPEYIDDISKVIESQRIIQAVDNRLSDEALVILHLLELADKGQNHPDDAIASIPFKGFVASLKSEHDELKWMKSKHLGNILRRVGMHSLLIRHGQGMVIRYDLQLISKCVERMGLDGEKHLKAKELGLNDFE